MHCISLCNYQDPDKILNTFFFAKTCIYELLHVADPSQIKEQFKSITRDIMQGWNVSEYIYLSHEFKYISECKLCMFVL